MDIRIVRNCEVKLDGVVKALTASTLLNLPAEKANRLIAAGFAEPITAAEEARTLAEEFEARSPGGGCWDWVKKHHPELWSQHFKAYRQGNVDTARETYSDMLSAWEQRNTQQQPELLAA